MFPLVLLFLSFVSSCLIIDPDLGWHIRLGDEMIRSHILIHNLVGYNNFFSALKLPDHEWLSDILLVLIYKQIGFYGLCVVSAIITTLILATVIYLCNSKKASAISITLALTLFFLPLSQIYGVRLQVLLLLLAILLLCIGLLVPNFKVRLVLNFVLFFFFSKLHAGTLALILIPITCEFLYTHNENNLKTISRLIGKIFVLFIAIIVAISINPYGLDLWRLSYDYWVDNFYKTNIAEWRPIYSIPILWQEVVFISTIIFFLFINLYWKKIPIPILMMLSIFLIAGCLHIRFLPIFAILVLPYLALSINDFQKNVINGKSLFALQVTAFLIVSLVLLMRAVPSQIQVRPALEFVKNTRPEEGNMLNSYAVGGLIVWKYPDLKVFIDGRGPQLKINNNTTILQEYCNFFTNDKAKTELMLKKYDISYVVIKKDQFSFSKIDKLLIKLSSRNHNQYNYVSPNSNLFKFLDDSPVWKKVFEDNSTIVYYKT